jgi:hypothetical protein
VFSELSDHRILVVVIEAAVQFLWWSNVLEHLNELGSYYLVLHIYNGVAKE